MKLHIKACVLSALLSMVGGQVAQACAFHGYAPSQTLVDRLLETEQVVVVRLSPNDPNKYVPVATLMGPVVSDIPIVPSALAQNSLSDGDEYTVLLARDGSYGPWREITLLDDRVRVLVEAVLQRQSAWLLGGEADRVQMFAKLVNDANPNVRRLALQELDRAPYAVLKATPIPAVRNLAQDPQVTDSSLTPIRILLVGLSQDQRYVAQLTESLDLAVAQDVAFTGAYATALIELSGTTGVAHIRDQYLQRPDLPAITRDRLLQALAIQYRSSDAATRRFITQEIASLSRSVPGFQDAAAAQFGFDNL